MNNRICEVRTRLNLTRAIFAEEIGISVSGLRKLESGENNPSEQTIRAICREYKVNRKWLETGEGEPFKEVTRDVEIAQFLGKVLSGDRDFKYRLASVLARLTVDEWELLERKCRELMAEDEETPGE